ncbi:hypothetical protein B0T17DRAFT_510207 [Bombardia bombarda]|uniref:Zn(2)-C6 fungal-type domain-containing protein n=1 Tax=Bombardia bombarda TaxID=252184 RepID=A0AA40BVX7_9PEZI|nr:hypothetical protein B0T17DRAFT_510207 [Bombardia bombarda]
MEEAGADKEQISGVPAAYGKACSNCFRAKCRCIYRTEGPACERCHRLKKECVPSMTVRKRHGRRPPLSRAAQLEEKLEGLVSLLQKQTAIGEANPAPTPSPTTALVSLPTSIHDEPYLGVNTPALSTHSTITSRSNHGDDNSSPPESFPRLTSCVPVRGLLGNPYQPVFDARPVTPPELAHSSCGPYSSYQPTPLEAEENLDIFRKHMLGFLPFVHLPTSLSAERLREQYPFLWFNIMMINCKYLAEQRLMSEAAAKYIAQKMVVENEANLDLLLGILASMACLPGCSNIRITFNLKKNDTLDWTPHMDDHLRNLSHRREWDGDDMLVAQVKMQLIIEQLAGRTAGQPDVGNSSVSYHALLRNHLESIIAQLPPHLTTYLQQSAIHRLKPASLFTPDFQRYELLESSLAAVKSWFELHLSLSSKTYLGMTFIYWCNMVHCIMSLHQLSALDDPAWDRRAVKDKIDILSVCDQLLAAFEGATTMRRVIGPSVHEDTFVTGMKVLKAMRAGFVMELEALERNTKEVEVALMDEAAAAANGAPLPMPLFELGESENWLADLVGMNWE